MNQENKVIIALLIFVLSFGSIGFYFANQMELNREITKREMYKNWDKFSEIEKQQLLNK